MTKLIRWTTWRWDTPPKASKEKWTYPKSPATGTPNRLPKKKAKGSEADQDDKLGISLRDILEIIIALKDEMRESQDNGREDELAGRSNQREVPSTSGRYKTASQRGDQEGKRANGNRNKRKFQNSGRWYEGKVHGDRQDTTRLEYIGAVHKKGQHQNIWNKGDTTIEIHALKVLKDHHEIDICQNDIEISHRAGKFRPEGRQDPKKAGFYWS